MKLLSGRLRWVLIFWVFLMGAISYLDRVNISIAQQAVQKDFGIDKLQLGWVFSAFVLGYALFQTPGGRLADRFGPRKVIGIGVLWWSLFTALTALVPIGLAGSLWLLIGTRFLLGIGEAVVYPASNRLVAAWIPTAERGIANGFIFCGVGVGAGIAPPLITYIMTNYGWHWSFYASALIGIAACAGWYILATDRPRQHSRITKEEAAFIEAGLPAAAEVSRHQAAPWRTIFGNKSMRFLTLSYFTYGYSAWIFFTWFYRYLSEVRGLNLKASAIYSMLPFLMMAICSLLGGWIADVLTKRFGKRVGRCGIGVAGLSGAALFIALGTQAASGELASIILALGIGAQYLAQSSYWAVTADIAGRSAGSASGLMNMGNQIGGAITASLTPWIAQKFGWTPSFLVAAGLCLVGAVAWLQVDPTVRLETE